MYFEKDFFPKPLVIRISDRLLLKDSSMRPISNIIQPKVYVQLLVNYKGVVKKIHAHNICLISQLINKQILWLDQHYYKISI